MNVYQKLAGARIEFMKLNVKMTGNNKFAGYSYFELSDILPAINKLSADIGFVCFVSFTDNLATLIFRDTEKPEDTVSFTSPMSTAGLKGCHEVQNLGAVETYIKRYLYQNCFEIVEADAVNGTQGKPEDKKGAEPKIEKETPDIVKAKDAVIDYINMGPTVFNDKWMKYADEACKRNDLEALRLCIAEAVKRLKASDGNIK